MHALAVWAALVAVAGAVEPDAAGPEPTDQAVIYYNARMALREEEPLEALKLWLLRNAVADRTGRVSGHDDDFHSVTWAALGELGVCQDGLDFDEDGVGLWPVALFNWVVRNMGRVPTKGPKPFEAFQAGQQLRRVSVNDVLSLRELHGFEPQRVLCLRPGLLLLAESEPVDLSDRQVAARLLRYLLDRARSTLDRERVRGLAVLEARIFDLELMRMELAAREARQQARERQATGRGVGMSSTAVAAMRADAAATTLPMGSHPDLILRGCVEWPISEWMALSPDRRLFLFDRALAHGVDPDALDRVALGILDRLIVDGEGAQAEAWIARARDPRAIWSGDRGRRLLALDPASGFDERAVIALHRGVHELEGGDLTGALRSFALALQEAPSSAAADEVGALGRRWLSYVASQFASTHELLVTLQELVPHADYSAILEDLMWRAAFRADAASFETGLAHQRGRGALERRLALLRPMASGDLGRFLRGVRDGLARSPSETLRFLGQLVQRLELEDAHVRADHAVTLARLRDLVRPLADRGSGAQVRAAEGFLVRTQAILEGQGALDATTARERGRALSPSAGVFGGSVRLAPADPLPWPFAASPVSAPSVFTPLTLTPIEWRDPAGELVFGWRIEG